MPERCPVCLRPYDATTVERPCSVPLGQRCFELGFERLRKRVELLEADPVIASRILELPNA